MYCPFSSYFLNHPEPAASAKQSNSQNSQSKWLHILPSLCYENPTHNISHNLQTGADRYYGSGPKSWMGNNANLATMSSWHVLFSVPTRRPPIKLLWQVVQTNLQCICSVCCPNATTNTSENICIFSCCPKLGRCCGWPLWRRDCCTWWSAGSWTSWRRQRGRQGPSIWRNILKFVNIQHWAFIDGDIFGTAQ